jgi:hypothetical protein
MFSHIYTIFNSIFRLSMKLCLDTHSHSETKKNPPPHTLLID